MAFILIFLTIVFTVAGQLLVKQGVLALGESPTQLSGLPMFVIRAFLNWKVTIGLSCAVVAAIFWILAVSRSDLSFAYPFMALSIVLVLILSGLILGETIPLTRWIGAIIVVLGIAIAAQ